MIKKTKSEEQSLKQKRFKAPVTTEPLSKQNSHYHNSRYSNSNQQSNNHNSSGSSAYGSNDSKTNCYTTKNNNITIIVIAIIVVTAVAAFAYFSSRDGYEDWESSERSDWVLPDSEYTVYYEDDFKEMGLSLDDIQLAINEIYAYYGYEFDGSLYEHFCTYDWYDPDTTDAYTIESRFSDTDRETFLNLCDYRKKLKNQ